jgi:hypothetical protein
MNVKNWREIAFLLSIIGCVSYVVLTTIAMFFYGGGSEMDPNSPGFSLSKNYLGDLVRTVSHSGKDNTISRIVAGTGSIMFSIFLIPALIASFHFFTMPLQKKSAALGIIFGVLFATTFMLLIIFYYNYYLALFTYIFLLFTWIFYLIAFYLNKELTRVLTYLIIIALVVLLIGVQYYFLPYEGLGIISQKVIWYTMFAYFAIQGYLLHMHLKKKS